MQGHLRTCEKIKDGFYYGLSLNSSLSISFSPSGILLSLADHSLRSCVALRQPWRCPPTTASETARNSSGCSHGVGGGGGTEEAIMALLTNIPGSGSEKDIGLNDAVAGGQGQGQGQGQRRGRGETWRILRLGWFCFVFPFCSADFPVERGEKGEGLPERKQDNKESSASLQGRIGCFERQTSDDIEMARNIVPIVV